MGETRDLCKRLVSQGLKISESKKAQEFLQEYLHVCRPDRRARTVERIGWADKNFNTFVLPDETIPSNGTEMMLLKDTRDMSYFKRRGTLAEWKCNIGDYCSGNSRLLFAVSCAAAAPLLPLFGEQSGGFHLFATTSVGKTTVLKVAGSFWGGGGPNGFVESWAITSNALENMAESHNNVLLLLDELTLSDPEQSSDVIYKMSTGQAKGRMKRDTYAQRRPEWSLLFLSSGEKDVETHTESTQKRRIYGGQEVRFCGIPAQVDETSGAFESVHHFKSPKLFADHLKEKSDKYYGEPSREFMRRVIGTGLGKVRERIEVHRLEFRGRYLSGSEGADVARAGDRFAFVAACGELAAEFGVTGWNRGEAMEGVGRCYKDWIKAQGTDGNLDETRAINYIKGVLAAHGNSRFQLYKVNGAGQIIEGPENKFPTRDRLGYRRQTAIDGNQLAFEGMGTTEYIILSPSMKEFCGPFPVSLVLQALQKRGLVKHLQRTLPEGIRPRCYVIDSRILSDSDEDNSVEGKTHRAGRSAVQGTQVAGPAEVTC